MESEDGLVQMGESLERNILVSAEVGCHRHDVGAVGYGSIHLFRKLPLAAMPAGALDLHRHVLTTVAAIGSGMSTTWRVALTIAASISSGFPHSGHTETGYHCWVSVTFSD